MTDASPWNQRSKKVCGRTTAILTQRWRPTESKARPRDVPEGVGDRGDPRLHHLVTDVDGLGGGQESSQAVKNSRLIAPRDKIGRHDDVVLTAIVNRGNPYQALRIRIRQRSHEHGVDDAEHRRVQTDPECQCEHDNEAEARRANAQTEAVSRVLDELIPPSGDPNCARRFLGQHGVAECPPGCHVRVVWRHPAGDVLFGFAEDVIGDLIVQIIETFAPAATHAGLSTRAIARTSFCHFDVSMASCFRPVGVRR